MIAGALAAASIAALLALIGASPAAAAPPCTGAPAGGNWPSYGHDAANTRSQPAEHTLTPGVVPGLAPKWVFSTSTTGDGSSFQSTPVVAGGCVFAGSTGGVAYAVDAATGKPVWQRQLDAPTPGLGGALVGAPAVSGTAVIFLVSETDAPYAIALDRSTGQVLWRSAPVTTEPGSYTNASTVVAGGVVFMGYSPPKGDSSSQGGFALLDAATGRS